MLINDLETNVYVGNETPLATANLFRYSGYQFDPETEWYYVKARYYSPFLGRFVTEDPVISMNRYVYCLNNPVNFVDPTGNDGISELSVIFKKGHDFAELIYSKYPGLYKNTYAKFTSYGYRIPDIINRVVIGKIKNVIYQSYTRQIRGFIELTRNTPGAIFIVIVEERTKLAKPLLRAIDRIGGKVIRISSSTGKVIRSFMFIIDKKTLDELMKLQIPGFQEVY